MIVEKWPTIALHSQIAQAAGLVLGHAIFLLLLKLGKLVLVWVCHTSKEDGGVRMGGGRILKPL